MDHDPGISVNHARLARENDVRDATIANKLPTGDRATLVITFHLRSKVTKTIMTKDYDNAMHANDSFLVGMCRPYGAVSIDGLMSGRKTKLLVNYSTVVFITIDEVPSESDAE